MDIFKRAIAIVVTTTLGMGANALGQTTSPPTTTSRATGATLTIPELAERLSREGYSDIRAVERESDKLFKVKARDAQGRIQEMLVDARSAEILASEQDDEKKEKDD
jgi:Peptidase propeptide and YPEB domain